MNEAMPITPAAGFFASAARDYFRPLESLAQLVLRRGKAASNDADAAPPLQYLSDQPNGPDRFGRERFAEVISGALVLPRDAAGLVVGIDGVWGSGKTFIVREIHQHLLKAHPAPIVVEFAPWLVSGSNAVIESLIEQLSAAISNEGKDGRSHAALSASQSLLKYLAVIRYFKYLKYVPGASAFGSLAEDIPEWAEKIGTAAKTISSDLLDQPKGKGHDLNAARNKVIDALRRLDRPIVVIIDDIDRLPHTETRSVMQAVKAVANFSRTAYLLAYDSGVVSAALAEDANDGRRYLDKIVQVEYQVPVPLLWRMRTFVQSVMQESLTETQRGLSAQEQSRWDEALSYVTRLVRTPRDVVRVANRLRISLQATKHEVDACDVVVFETLAVCAEAIARAIRDHPDEFVATPDFDFESFGMGFYFDRASADESQQADQKKRWDKFLPPDASEFVRGAVNFLFAGDNVGALRVSNWDRLYRLLSLGPSEFLTEVSDLRRLVNDAIALREALSTDDRSVLAILRGLETYRGQLEIVRVDSYLLALCQAATARLKADDTDWRELAEQYADVFEIELRQETAASVPRFELIVDNAPLSISERLVLTAATDLGLWGHRSEPAKPVADRLVKNIDSYRIVLSRWLERLQRTASADLVKEPRLISVLYRWGQLSGDFGAARQAARTLVRNYGLIDKFIEGIGLNSELPFEVGSLDLAWDGKELADLMEMRDASRYRRSIEILARDDVADYFKSRTSAPTFGRKKS